MATRRIQLTLAGLMWATFWTGVGFASWVRVGSPGDSPKLLTPSLVFGVLVMFEAFPVAVGALLRRTVLGAVIGLIIIPVLFFILTLI